MYYEDERTNIIGLLGTNKNNGLPCQITNPFGMEYIDTISIWAIKSWDNSFSFSANIKFKRGSTKAEQEIKGENLGDVIQKVYQFCQNIDSNNRW
jgi:hypothetical protein